MLSVAKATALVPLVALIVLSVVTSTSYSSDGIWDKVDKTADEQACKQFTCSPSGYIWRPNPPTTLYNNVTACDALIKKGIKKIVYYGDSYIRHIYAAMLITLNGNYESGSMANPAKDPLCRYHTLFQEKRCNYWNLNHNGMVCDGKVFMDPLLTGIRDSIFKQENGTVALWSFGNHQLAHGRYGVNDGAAYQALFEKEGTCPYFREHKDKLTGKIDPNGPYSVWWVSTHQRVRQHFPDEAPDKVRKYNHDMRSFFESGQCGHTNYIDVFNVTDKLVTEHNEEAHKLTFDQVHWGYEVNLIKAQIILNALLSS